MDLYTDYLLSRFGQVTATGLSNLLDGSISHDKITRMLFGKEYSSKEIWQDGQCAGLKETKLNLNQLSSGLRLLDNYKFCYL